MVKSSGRTTQVAGVEAEPRERRFMRSALAILGETGRTDFTVLEVVERSKTSLRSFYQHFSTKDELLLALIDKIMSESTRKWRMETEERAPVDALHELIKDIIARGIAEGSFRAGISIDATAALIMQTALGAMRLQLLGAELNGVPVEGSDIYDFCIAALSQPVGTA